MNLQSMIDFVSRNHSPQVEAYFEQYHLTDIKADDDSFHSASSSLTRGLGIRVIDEGRLGFAHTSDLDRDSIESTFERAKMNCRLSSSQGAMIPSDNRSPAAGQWDHPSLSRFNMSDGLRLINRMRNGAGAVAKGSSVLAAKVTVGQRIVRVVNNQNIVREFEAAYFNSSLTVSVADEAEQSTGHASIFGRDLDNFDPERLGKDAARIAAESLGATPCVEGEMPIVFAPTASTQLLGAISPIFVGQGRAGVFKDKVGHQIASPLLTIVDDPTRSEVVGSGPFDGEGVAGYKKFLIKDGVLQGYLHNSETARQNGLDSSTGNAARYAYSDLPGVGLSVMYIQPGDESLQDITERVKDGLLITKLRGVATGINPSAGTISVSVIGKHIVNGEVARPVKNVTLVGFVADVLERVAAVGEDLWFRGPIGAPSLTVDYMRVLRGRE